jgi:hypothetical protein
VDVLEIADDLFKGKTRIMRGIVHAFLCVAICVPGEA